MPVAFFENRNQHLFSGSGISCALEDHQLTRLQVRRQRFGRAGYVTHVGLVILI